MSSSSESGYSDAVANEARAPPARSTKRASAARDSLSVSDDSDGTGDTDAPSRRRTHRAASTAAGLPRTPGTAVSILDRITQDYKKCVHLGDEYRHKHRELVEMYKVVSKMTLMWQETWFETGSAASAPMQKLVDIVRTHGPHLLSDDELAGMKRTQDQIRNRMEQMSRDVDKRFYSPANPVFQSLSDDDRREILHDKGRREEMLRQQMRTMGLEVDEFDDTTFGPDARHVDEYALTFANEYFGEDLFERDRSAAWSDGVLLDTAVGSPGTTVRNRFVDFLKGHESGAIPAGITDVGRYVGDGPLLDRLSDKGLLRGADTPLSTAVTRILATGNGVPALDTPFDSLALYHTDLLAKAGARPVGHIPDARSLLRDHPLMDPEATFDEGADPEVIEMHWAEEAHTWFKEGYDVCLHAYDQDTDGGPDAVLFAMVWQTKTARSFVLTSYDADPESNNKDYEVSWVPTHGSGAIDTAPLATLSATSGMTPADGVRVVVPRHPDDAYGASTVDAFCRALTTHECHCRADVLYRLVWHACIQTGASYPVVPTLPFVTGLRPTTLDPRRVPFWFGGTSPDAELPSFAPPEVTLPADIGEALSRSTASDEPAVLDWLEALECRMSLHVHTHTLLTRSGADDDVHPLSHKPLGGATMPGDPVHAAWHEAACADFPKGARGHKAVGGSTFDAARLDAYVDRLFEFVVGLSDKTTKDLPTLKAENTLLRVGYAELREQGGPLLALLYHQLGKTRTCPFVHTPFVHSVASTFDDVVNALEMHMELFEHAVTAYTHLPSKDDDPPAHVSRPRTAPAPKQPHKKGRKGRAFTSQLERYADPAYFKLWAETETNTDTVVYSYSTFKAVFGTPQLHTWMRDTDPFAVSKYLQQQLALDIVDSTVVSVDFVLEMLTVVYDRAFGGVSDKAGESLQPSASLVHLLRLLLNNLGVWELPLRIPKWRNVVEKHLDALIQHPDHPFREELTVNDVLFGHPSPLALARLFVSGIQYVHANARLPKDKAPPPSVQAAFARTFDHALEGVKHPNFSGQLLRFRDLLLEQPDADLMYRLWELVNIAEWHHPELWHRLLEYGVAVNTTYAIAHAPTRDPPRYFECLNPVLDTAEEVSAMDAAAVDRVRRKLKAGRAPATVDVRVPATQKAKTKGKVVTPAASAGAASSASAASAASE